MKKMKANSTESEGRVAETTNKNLEDEKTIDQECQPQECKDSATEQTCGGEALPAQGDGRQDNLEQQKAEPEATDTTSQSKTDQPGQISSGAFQRLCRTFRRQKGRSDEPDVELSNRVDELEVDNHRLQDRIAEYEQYCNQMQKERDETANLATQNRQLQDQIDERDHLQKEMQLKYAQLEHSFQQGTKELANLQEKMQQTTSERLFSALATLPRLRSKLKWGKGGVGPQVADLEARITELSANNEQLQNSISDAKVQHEQVQQACDELEQRLEQRTDELDSVKETLQQATDERDRVEKDLGKQIDRKSVV